MKQILTIKTCYGPINQQVLKRARNICLLICDADGVLTNRLIYMGNRGEELKTFNIHDGYGIRCLLKFGIEVAIITDCSDSLLESRCAKLGIMHLYQNQSDKTLAFKSLLGKLKLTSEQVAYVGDDLIDAPVIKEVGLSAAVADAHPLLRLMVNYVTRNNGGRGAVREICDLLLLSQGKLEYAKEQIT